MKRENVPQGRMTFCFYGMGCTAHPMERGAIGCQDKRNWHQPFMVVVHMEIPLRFFSAEQTSCVDNNISIRKHFLLLIKQHRGIINPHYSDKTGTLRIDFAQTGIRSHIHCTKTGGVSFPPAMGIKQSNLQAFFHLLQVELLSRRILPD